MNSKQYSNEKRFIDELLGSANEELQNDSEPVTEESCEPENDDAVSGVVNP